MTPPGALSDVWLKWELEAVPVSSYSGGRWSDSPAKAGGSVDTREPAQLELFDRKNGENGDIPQLPRLPARDLPDHGFQERHVVDDQLPLAPYDEARVGQIVVLAGHRLTVGAHATGDIRVGRRR